MALFGMEIGRRQRSPTFHVDDLNKRSKLRANRTMTNARLLGTSVSLLLGGFMSYTAIHYVPALFPTSKVLSMSNLDSVTQRIVPGDADKNFLAPYFDLLEVRRTYLRPGQSISAEYDLPRGTIVELRIRKCQKAIIREVFECRVTGERKMRVANKTSGSHQFKFQEGGFYMFDERIIRQGRGKKPSRILWRRG